MIELKQDESQEIKIGDFVVIIKHNDVGISIDITKDENYLIEDQHWFDDLEHYYKYELGL